MVHRSKGLSTLAPTVQLPLRRLALCLDCDGCFEVGGETCPGCGSTTWCLLARFLDVSTPPASTRSRSSSRQLIVVARNRPDLYDHLRRAFSGNATVDVVQDRRSRSLEVGATSRRRARDLSHALRTFGFVVVRPADLR